MKAVAVLAIAVVSIVASSSIDTLSSTVSGLFGQVTTLAKAVAVATGKPLQPLVLSSLALPANLLQSVTTLSSTTLATVDGVLGSASNQINGIVSSAGTDLNRLLPAVRSVQNILTSTVSSLNAFNVPALDSLTGTLSNLSSTLGRTVAQITG
ncbi:AGAP007830-PA-like protein [Anopheles sinensis]|uniref:AGAP007830-PA-like protein n=1 Tax=Anopheles sinensis TaxID=74873 RepID=A0A084VBB5_ANOSI|nr:AGAP007830-PA-like protein [Anopheles sinensis]